MNLLQRILSQSIESFITKKIESSPIVQQAAVKVYETVQAARSHEKVQELRDKSMNKMETLKDQIERMEMVPEELRDEMLKGVSNVQEKIDNLTDPNFNFLEDEAEQRKKFDKQ